MVDSTTLSGIVRSAELATAIENVSVFLITLSGQKKKICTTDHLGRWNIQTTTNNEKLNFSKDGYVNKTFNTHEVPSTIRLLKNKLVGYQQGLSFFPGSTVRCFVHSEKPFSAQLCRHGLTKEVLQKQTNISPCSQTVPDDCFVSTGLNWTNNYTYKIPKNARPGIYSLLLTDDNRDRFAIPLIVCFDRHRQPKNKILVLASTNNWLAYNFWGGRSRYRNNESGETKQFTNLKSLRTRIARGLSRVLSEKQILHLQHLVGKGPRHQAWKFKKLSINRPITNCLLEGDDPKEPFTNHLASGEWRLLAWLELNSYAYDIVSGEDLHKNPEILMNYSALVCSTHCEYWTNRMFEGVKKAHQKNNMWIINLSGNTMYREIDFFEDGSIRCTSLRFSDSCADETQLIGVRFSNHDYSTAAPYKVLDADHWVFDGVEGVHNGTLFGKQSLNQNTKQKLERYDPGRPGEQYGISGEGASGWETDKISRNAPKDFNLVAKGLNKGGGADMVVREPNGSRGGVFSASSIMFSGCLLIDNTASAVVSNVVNKAISH